MQHRQLHYSVARNGQRTISLIFVFNTFSLQHRQLRLGSGRQDWVAVSVPSLVFLSLWTSLHLLSTASAATIRLRGTGETEFDAGFISRFFFWASSASAATVLVEGGRDSLSCSFSTGHFQHRQLQFRLMWDKRSLSRFIFYWASSASAATDLVEGGRDSLSCSFSSGHLQHRQLKFG